MATRDGEWSVDADAECRVSWMTMAGIVTASDILAAQRQLAAHDRFDPSFALVVDLRMAHDLPLSWLDAQTIVRNSPVVPRAPQAVVAGTIVGAAIGHAYGALHFEMTGAQTVRVCRSLGEACGWLGAPFDRLRDGCTSVSAALRIR
jgi:hypothetical protein